LGRIPTPAEYFTFASQIDPMAEEIYNYMNFNQIESFQKAAAKGQLIAANQIVTV
jgi:aconitate hydratase 2/2-methylisocitrate dehydratase